MPAVNTLAGFYSTTGIGSLQAKQFERTDNMLICRKSIRRKDGTIVTAAQLGLKAICFEVTDEQHQAYLDKKKNEKADKAG
ncbi:hypothetical protein [Paenibacillus sp. FSL R5-0923]|uniref:Uncharacterized protein n=2 Tax=Paenibacillus odorifer TaxID=189426 RepID=A0ABX3HFR8_9BACL|nr:hypothetical protein BSK51_21635 [Paenibacillus odorifer]